LTCSTARSAVTWSLSISFAVARCHGIHGRARCSDGDDQDRRGAAAETCRPVGANASLRVRSDETSTGRTGVNRFGASVILLALLPASWSWTPVSWPGRARWLGALLARHVSLSLHASVRPPHACGVRARPGIDKPSSGSALHQKFRRSPYVPR
jgi:hypothetical protein